MGVKEFIGWLVSQWWFCILLGFFCLYFAYKAANPKQKGYTSEQILEAENELRRRDAWKAKNEYQISKEDHSPEDSGR